ncbi:hypothetical protein [Aurantimonas marina]|uniref:hypothetical protein n=1 Tax=Aurantimonas marina TaxID=2780508 RepID=UPI0019CF931D|nr:hypothetical protein [Aurantimonas marina]
MFEAFAQENRSSAGPATAPETVEQAVEVDPAFALGEIEDWVLGFEKLLPNIVVALILLALFWGIGGLVGRGFNGRCRRIPDGRTGRQRAWHETSHPRLIFRASVGGVW